MKNSIVYSLILLACVLGSFFTNLDPAYLLLAPVLSLITDTAHQKVAPVLSPRLDAALTKSHKAAISKRKVVQCQCEKIKLEKLSYTIACGGQYLKLIVDFAHDPDDIKL
jgi:hypothetical protein